MSDYYLMSKEKIQVCKKSLLQEKQMLEAEQEFIQSQLDGIEDELKCVDEALAEPRPEEEKRLTNWQAMEMMGQEKLF